MKHTKALKKPAFWAVYLAVIAVAVVLDQLSKYFIGIATEHGGRNIPLIGDWLLLHWTENDGATGGIFHNLEWRNVLFFVMTLVGLPIFFYMLKRSRTRSVLGQVAFAFIIGGTLGNAIDRMFLAENGFFTGAVRDFVHVTWFFGIFNVADSFLVVGVALALIAVVWLDSDSLINSFREERCVKLADKARLQVATVNAAATEDTAIASTAENNVEEKTAEKNDDEKNTVD